MNTIVHHVPLSINNPEYKTLSVFLTKPDNSTLFYLLQGIMVKYFDNISKYKLSVTYDLVTKEFLIVGVFRELAEKH